MKNILGLNGDGMKREINWKFYHLTTISMIIASLSEHILINLCKGLGCEVIHIST